MNNKNKLYWIGGLILLIQIIVFWEHISPIIWGQLKISGLPCTCPDETVDKGRLYLRFITPDSLKKYNMNYSEIYVSKPIDNPKDPIGVDQYLITCRVIGKDRVDNYSPWNPKVKIEKWRQIRIIPDLIIKVLFICQILILGWMTINIKNKNGVQHAA